MIIKNAKIIYKDRIEEGSVQIIDGKIASIHSVCDDDEVIDAHGLYLAPGFIDIHIHGAGGKDTMEGTIEAVHVIAKAIAKHGTTSFCPTTMTMDIPSIRKVLSTVKEYKSKQMNGANVIGVHLEGPCINPDKLGAQNPEYVIEPTIKNMSQMIDGYEDLVVTITLAPEMIQEKNVIEYLNQKNIHVSMGHTCATYQEAIEGIQLGITHATHLYNAMTSLQHRNPGVVGAVFDTHITTELIADGIHIDYPALRIALKQKGTDKICLITDAMRGCAMPEGIYDLGGQTVYIKNGMAKLKDGTFAGTLLTLDEAVRQLSQHTDYPLYEIVKMATYNPARYCGIEKYKGQIETGYDADLILFDDNIDIKSIFIGGKLLKEL